MYPTQEDKEKAQYTYDVIAAHLLVQNAKSMDGTQCAYRGEGGLRCAIGFCISDAKYEFAIEGHTVHTSQVRQLIDAQYYSGYYFMDELQCIHDQREVIEWPTQLKQFAEEQGLDSSIVDITLAAKLPEVVASELVNA